MTVVAATSSEARGHRAHRHLLRLYPDSGSIPGRIPVAQDFSPASVGAERPTANFAPAAKD